MLKRLLLIGFFLFLCISGFATHNRSGEIIFTQNSFLTYTVSIVTYTKSSSPADRDSLEVNWGDNTTQYLKRTSFIIDIPGDIKRNEYTGVHTYPGPGVYKCSFLDPNRDANIINIPYPSDQVPFYVESKIVISSLLGGFNNSPRLLQPPIDKGVVGQVFHHNPNAFDPDGDSLAYHMDTCRGDGGLHIPGYVLPLPPGYAKNSFTLNPVTGDLTWDYPLRISEYNVAIKIIEYRKDTKGVYHEIGFVIRDMQIEISKPDTSDSAQAPVFLNLNDTCVEAGTLLKMNVKASQAANNHVTLTATGGPLALTNSPATFVQQNLIPAEGTFTWQTECSHIRKQLYQVVFKAKNEDPPQSTPPLSALKSIRIRVVAPAPKNLVASAAGNSVLLHWNPEICPQAIAYDIYRKADTTGFIPGPCVVGLPAYTGFVKIDRLNGILDTSYTDVNKGNGLVPGITYCYRVVAIFPDEVESYASQQACVELRQDLPIMSKASVMKTDSLKGVVWINWIRPNAAELDTLQNPGPYRYDLYRATNLSGSDSVLIHSSSSPYFKNFKDTVFSDSVGNSANTTVLNTVKGSLYYFVKFSSNHFYKGQSFPASTVFIALTPSDNRVTVKWNYSVPWTDSLFYIYWKNPATNTFDSIGKTKAMQYVDSGHANGVLRTYKVVSKGFFSGKGLPKSILNNSQEASATPIDNISPCPPYNLAVSQNCEEKNVDRLYNELSWDNPNGVCANDVIKVAVFYKRYPTDEYPSSSISVVESSKFFYRQEDLKENMAGCYALASIDSVGNMGPKSNSVCVDNCPVYTLPNAFSPNGDGFNEVFQPMKTMRFIKSIEMQIYDRWGVPMFSTTDPMINWDGTNQKNHKPCSSGTYYYICNVVEDHLEGQTVHTLKGFVELIRAERAPSNNNH